MPGNSVGQASAASRTGLTYICCVYVSTRIKKTNMNNTRSSKKPVWRAHTINDNSGSYTVSLAQAFVSLAQVYLCKVVIAWSGANLFIAHRLYFCKEVTSVVVEKAVLPGQTESSSSNNVISLKSAPLSGSVEPADQSSLVEMLITELPVAESTSEANSFDPIVQTEEDLLALEEKVCSHGDTVHYAKKPKIFAHCSGSYLYDSYETPYLDLQMWYSAVNLGYGNPRINNALKKQIDTLPQLACQYLHKEKIELSAKIVNSAKRAFGEDGRVHFNVGGSQAVEDAFETSAQINRQKQTICF